MNIYSIYNSIIVLHLTSIMIQESEGLTNNKVPMRSEEMRRLVEDDALPFDALKK